NLKIDKHVINPDGEIKVCIDITNIGRIAGEEIVQMYVGYKNSSVDRPFKDLKGFTKVFINPDEKKTIELMLKAEDLGYYDSNRKKWIVEKIEYVIYVGSSSRNEDLLSTTFKIS
ncbi:MAG: fibronectin type III-like domain-contianing protein, partial [Promethearchaeota archaeon]